MDLVNKDKNSGMAEPPVWSQYQGIVDGAEGRRVEVTRYCSCFYSWISCYSCSYSYPLLHQAGEVRVLQASQGGVRGGAHRGDGALWQYHTAEGGPTCLGGGGRTSWKESLKLSITCFFICDSLSYCAIYILTHIEKDRVMY